ncbi:MAG: hypothetical protein BGO98_40335 [Myxococcales bacterium 68-20]|nr:MAG: hypothetical protein BGO98_40335 [Myxococcales bacterium 68-20]
MPRLEDRYFASRSTSDKAVRSHIVHALRQLPVMAAQVVRCVLELVVTSGASCGSIREALALRSRPRWRQWHPSRGAACPRRARDARAAAGARNRA